MTERPSTTPPDRNLALELVRVTEAAALGADAGRELKDRASPDFFERD